jgi:hypothetical protein
MSTAEKIYEQTQGLPEPAQRAILQIVELLIVKSPSEDEEWSRSSLSTAAEGMQDEQWPDYTATPQFEKWQ